MISPAGLYRAATFIKSDGADKVFEVQIPEKQRVRLFVDTGLTTRMADNTELAPGKPSLFLTEASAETPTELSISVN